MMEHNKFLGKGWSFPPTFVKGINTVLMTEDEANINENLKVLFDTPKGERLLSRNFGSTLRKYLFAPQNSLLHAEIKDALHTAIKLYEPRIDVDEISILPDYDRESCLMISLSYTVVKVNRRHNFVYPFYINEGTNLSISQ
jgi:phage baseplate assembly protein W